MTEKGLHIIHISALVLLKYIPHISQSILSYTLNSIFKIPVTRDGTCINITEDTIATHLLLRKSKIKKAC